MAPIEPGDGGWPARKERLLERVHARGEAIHRRKQIIRGLSAAMAALLLAAVPGALAASGGGGHGKISVASGGSASTSEEPTTSLPGTRARTCGDGNADNQALCIAVIYWPASPRAGDEVTFHFTAVDPDRTIHPDTCGNVYSFGDKSAADCGLVGCAVPSSTSAPPAKEVGRFEIDFHHTYTSPGTYTAYFTLRSGTHCDGNPYDSEASVSMTVHVSR